MALHASGWALGGSGGGLGELWQGLGELWESFGRVSGSSGTSLRGSIYQKTPDQPHKRPLSADPAQQGNGVCYGGFPYSFPWMGFLPLSVIWMFIERFFAEFGTRRILLILPAFPVKWSMERWSDPHSTRAGGQDDVSLNKLPWDESAEAAQPFLKYGMIVHKQRNAFSTMG